MLTMIVGCAILALFVIFFKKIESEVLHTLILACGVIVIVTALFIPVSGYQEPELIDEIQLTALSDNTDAKDVFVRVMSNGECEYSVKEETVKLQVAEVFEADVDEAVLKVYTKTPKCGIWTFGIGASRDVYKIIVPMGTASYSSVSAH